MIVGGTGMYIEALTEGVTPIPETPGAIRSQIALLQKEQGLAAVYDLVAKNDPETAARLSPNDASPPRCRNLASHRQALVLLAHRSAHKKFRAARFFPHLHQAAARHS